MKAYFSASYDPRFFSISEKSWVTCGNFLGKWFIPPPLPKNRKPLRLCGQNLHGPAVFLHAVPAEQCKFLNGKQYCNL